MNLLCAIFGRKTLEKQYSGFEYFQVWGGAIDGIGREHLFLKATCPRCGKEYTAGKCHVPDWVKGKKNE